MAKAQIVIGESGGGGNGRAFVQSYPSITTETIDLGFEPDVVIFYCQNYYGSYDLYEVWCKYHNNTQVLQIYAGSMNWYSLSPSSSTSGIQQINGTNLVVTGNISSQVDIYAYCEI